MSENRPLNRTGYFFIVPINKIANFDAGYDVVSISVFVKGNGKKNNYEKQFLLI
jgi:hypothetical protein